MIHLDSSFLVDLLREGRRRERGPAHRLLAGRPDLEEACVSVHAVCELYVGVELTSHPEEERGQIDHLLSTMTVEVPGAEFPETYARLLVGLQARGMTVATMDLLIATAALCANAPLVTRNARHFERIQDLQLLTY